MDNTLGPLAVTLTGPESTGKTSLARALADSLGVPWSAEGARRYVERRAARGATAPLGPGDVEAIARLHVSLEDEAAERARRAGAPFVVRDTDLVSTVVYARYYYGACPRWVEDTARARRAALYLLCDVDVPWAPDPAQRDGSGAHSGVRAALRDAFVVTLGEFGCAYAWVRGGWAERRRAALRAVAALPRPGVSRGMAARANPTSSHERERP